MSAAERLDPTVNWDCRDCVGGQDGVVVSPPDEDLRRRRGSCGGPFPLGPDGKPLLREARLDDLGVAYVPGDWIVNDPRFQHTRWECCPLALVNRPGCPSPKVPRWLHTVTEAANWMNDGGALSDFAPDAPSVFRAAVAAARRAADAARTKDRADSAAMGAAADAATGARGSRR